MTDDNRPQPDPDDDPTTVTRWPPFGQPAANAPVADETQTQRVPADEPQGESPAQPSAETADQGGWFTPTTPQEPQWADWDQPWQPSDEPFDQAALPPTETEARPEPPVSEPASSEPLVSEPAVPAPPTPETENARNPEPAAPLEYVSPYPVGQDWAAGTGGDPQAPVDEPSSGAAAGAASWANLHHLRVLAQVACPILLFVGLTFSEDDVQRGWQAYTAWAIFAMVCAIAQLAPLAGRSLGLTVENAWFLAAVGTAGLVGYWVIIVLPGVSSNTGFAQTLATAFAVIGLWLSPGRRT